MYPREQCEQEMEKRIWGQVLGYNIEKIMMNESSRTPRSGPQVTALRVVTCRMSHVLTEVERR